MTGQQKLHPLGKAALALTIALAGPLTIAVASQAAVVTGWQTVQSDRPSMIDTGVAKLTGELDTLRRVSVTVTLPLTHKADLDRFVDDVSTPGRAAYGHYLTPSEFAARYGASQPDYDAILSWAKANNLTVTQTSTSRNAVSLSGTAGQLGKALNVKFSTYVDAQGASFFAASTAPRMPVAVAAGVRGVYGLSDHAQGHPMHVISTPGQRASGREAANLATGKPVFSTADGDGTGHAGAFSPKDLFRLFQMPDLYNGKGQAIGCYENGAYFDSDPITYRNYYHLPKTPIIDRLVAGSNPDPSDFNVILESALDIEMEMALAPHAKGIYVYEAGNESSFSSSLIDTLTAVADDRKISAFEISYGLDEFLQLTEGGPGAFEDEQDAFKRCAAEGITVYASAGDFGAYGDDGTQFSPVTYNVSDPASQPYVTGVGGTTVFTSHGHDLDEIAWNELATTGYATGGGVSDIWKLPSYQEFADGTPLTTFNGGSGSYRNVPDVAAVADSLTPVDVYCNEYGGWLGVGGTSVSAPIWAGFTALVNQQRVDAGLPLLGFANPALYNIYKFDLGGDEAGETYDFDDVADNSNGNANLFGRPGFQSGYGYDNTTGLGSLSGQFILKNLVAPYSSIYNVTPGLPDAPSQFQNVALTPTSASFTWQPAMNATGYVVLLFKTDTYYGGGTRLQSIGTSTVHSYGTVLHLEPSTSYVFRLVAVNTIGAQSIETIENLNVTTPAS